MRIENDMPDLATSVGFKDTSNTFKGASLMPQKQTAPSQVVPPIGSQNSVTSAPALDPSSLDPQVVKVMQTIRNVESQGNYNAVGDNGSSLGAYQWNNGKDPVKPGDTPANWKTAAAKYLGSENAPMSPANQNYVAYHQIADYKNQGLTPNSIDALWNGAKPDPVNPGQYVHINDSRANEFNAALANIVNNNPQANPQQPYQAGQDNGGNMDNTQAPSLGGFAENTVKSGANFVGNLVNAASHPLQTLQNLGTTAAGGLQELGGQSNDNTQKWDGLVNYFKQRYGSVDNFAKTAYTDPVGVFGDASALLGVGGGALGVVGKGAELAGAGGVADALGNAGKIAGEASAGLNPLTPIVKAAGVGLTQAAKLSDIIANPSDYTSEQIANSSIEKVSSDVQNSLDESRASLSETGSHYQPLKETPAPIQVEPDSLDNIIRDSLKVDVNDGIIKPNSTSLLRDSAGISKLQGVYNTYKSDFLNGSMDSEKFLNLRSDLAGIAYNDLGIKNTNTAGAAAAVRSSLNKSFRPQIPQLEALDSEYESKINKINELEDGIVYKTGSNKGDIKTSFINNSLKAVKNEDSDKLAQLEEILPGITKRLQVMKTMKDLGSPNFTMSLLDKAGLAGGILSGNIKITAAALSAMILQSPAIAVPLMRAIGATLPLVKEVLAHLAKSLTLGEVQSNVEQSSQGLSTPQSQTDSSQAKSQGQTTGNPSGDASSQNDITQTLGYQAAIQAGYTPQEIQEYLSSQ